MLKMFWVSSLTACIIAINIHELYSGDEVLAASSTTMKYNLPFRLDWYSEIMNFSTRRGHRFRSSAGTRKPDSFSKGAELLRHCTNKTFRLPWTVQTRLRHSLAACRSCLSIQINSIIIVGNAHRREAFDLDVIILMPDREWRQPPPSRTLADIPAIKPLSTCFLMCFCMYGDASEVYFLSPPKLTYWPFEDINWSSL